MKQILFLLLFLFSGFGFPVEAQGLRTKFESIDTAKFKCTYQFKFLKDSIKTEYIDNGPYIILIGEDFAESYFYKTFYLDSAWSTPEGGGKLYLPMTEFVRTVSNPKNPTKEEIEMLKKLTPTKGSFPFYVFKNYKEGKISVTDIISSYNFHYDDELKPQEWTILEDTMTVLDYPCQKAICNWRGRDWEAWFAPDIPIDEGPWKFYGLPGLIMKLDDTELHYSFNMIGLQQESEPMYMFVKPDARKINRLSFLKLKMNRTGTDLVAMDLAKVGIGNSESIEFHYDYIERDYK